LQKIRNLHEYAYANMTIMGNFYNLHSKRLLMIRFFVLLELTELADTENRSFLSRCKNMKQAKC